MVRVLLYVCAMLGCAWRTRGAVMGGVERRTAALAGCLLSLCVVVSHAGAQDILFVTQPPFGSDFTTINSTFGNHLAHTGAAPRGGDLYIRYADGTLRNLTAEAGFGLIPGSEIAVREPSVHWSGAKALFSMVVGGTIQNDYMPVYWQIYEVTGLGLGEAVSVTRLPQPADYNNVSPLYGRDDRILFSSDRPRNGNRLLYPQLDEYESAPTNTGLWTMNADGTDLRLIDHAVSGVFTPIVASDGRVIFTRWDHLQRDQQNYNGAPYGAFNYVSEESEATTGDAAEIFPEPRTQQAGSPIHGHRINIFLPWQIFEDGTGHETLNHVGRHELSHYFNSARDGLPEFIPPASRRTADRIFHLAEDPNRAGYFFATFAPEFQTHSAGQIIGLDDGEQVNPEDMQIDYVSDPISDAPLGEGQTTPSDHPGLFRNPLPLSDGTLVAVRSTEARGDRRTGGALSSRYDFHLVRLVEGDPYYTPGEVLIPGGISKSISYFDNYEYRQHTYDGPLWQLDPVEVRARPRPPARSNPLPAIEAAVLDEELGAAGTAALRQFLTDNELALIVSRNVTRRADRQQDFNLKVASSSTETSEPGSTPAEVAFVQLFQADQLRGYANFNSGRRPIAALLRDGLLPEIADAPAASVRVAGDGSFAAFVPSSRALSWHMTDAAGNALVRERYWVSFASGEIRVCANCHGLNRTDVVLDEGPPTNPPDALRELVQWWQSSFGPTPGPNPTPTPTSAPTYQVGGRIHYDGSGLAVDGVDVGVSGPASSTVASDEAGNFSFSGLVGGDWQLTPAKSGDRNGAVSAYDAALVLRATLGEGLAPLAAAACDVTGNGTLSPLDAVRILQFALGSIERLPIAEACDSDWVFSPDVVAGGGRTTVDPAAAGGVCTPASMAFSSLSSDWPASDFRARVFGDCSGNWSSSSAAVLQGFATEREPARLRFGRSRPRGRRYVEVPIWLHARAPLHSLEVRLSSAGGRPRFRSADLPNGVIVRQRRVRSGLAIAMASGRALQPRSLRVGSLLLPVSADRRRSRRDLRVEALVDDVPIRVHLPR